MAQSKQAAAIDAASIVLSFAARFQGLLNDVKTFKAKSDHVDYVTLWQHLPTAPWNENGTISDTPDETPVLTNPITLGGINRSENDLLGQLYLMADFISFMTNGTVSQSDRSGPLDNLVG